MCFLIRFDTFSESKTILYVRIIIEESTKIHATKICAHNVHVDISKINSSHLVKVIEQNVVVSENFEDQQESFCSQNNQTKYFL